MRRTKADHKGPVIDYKTKRKSMAIPDQSLSIQEIVKRYVRGVPVDIVQREGVYLDQDELDMEKMTREDFGTKHEMAIQFAENAKAMKSELDERQRLVEENAAKAKQDRIKAKAEKAAKVGT